ncbi:MAG: transposase family protein [Treponema sp.]|jgi:hypothetical protein|nr:transposase family protein [Treponema sp.]
MADGKSVKIKAGTTTRRKRGGRKLVYGSEVTASLRLVWAFFWYQCGRKRSFRSVWRRSCGSRWAALPLPLRGLDSDNGPGFINHALLSWCDSSRIQFTRGRAYHKNDNCFVEQKNDACVLCRSLCPLLNYFLPSVKLVSKNRIGSKIRKVYGKFRSPYRRLLASPSSSRFFS